MVELSARAGGAASEGLPTLFRAAFTQSKNAMTLVDERRRLVDANGGYIKLVGYERHAIIGRPISQFVSGGPLFSPREWRAALAAGRSSGVAELICAGGDRVAVSGPPRRRS